MAFESLPKSAVIYVSHPWGNKKVYWVAIFFLFSLLQPLWMLDPNAISSQEHEVCKRNDILHSLDDILLNVSNRMGSQILIATFKLNLVM